MEQMKMKRKGHPKPPASDTQLAERCRGGSDEGRRHISGFSSLSSRATRHYGACGHSEIGNMTRDPLRNVYDIC
jgi:hypothetical protein